ncbi:hypothetical protein Ctob_013122 [Chrysochromulina tobinii]|uniref:Uncharacterized protein n=1 Tax=Chrysochromulina tobinii TaxID=1460289 RepID=A0A0M0K2C2_9EUKA|nr:hypothetical protein Ctob_013122 [Chrysochromulina tobinii]|eukprot:KOO32949.1 hypothetical protein Ctob_013122 [Chrysochromulina sp. CCMP291]
MDAEEVERKVNHAIAEVRKALDRARTEPKVAGEVHHEYEDKYCLAEGVVSVAAASWLQCLETLGLDETRLRLLCEVARAGRHALTMRCNVSEKCTFKKKVEREIPSTTKHVTTTAGFLKTESKIVTTVTEWFWDVELTFQILVFAGAEPELDTDAAAAAAASSGLPAPVLILSRTSTIELVTQNDCAPASTAMRYPAIDVDVTWLFARPTAEGLQVTFRIDRTKDECRTPRRCPEVEAVLRFGQELNGWCESVRRTVFNRRVQIAQAYSHRNAEGDAKPPLDYAQLWQQLPHAVMPVLTPEADTAPAGSEKEDEITAEGAPVPGTVVGGVELGDRRTAVVASLNAFGTRPRSLGAADLDALVKEERRALSERLAALAESFPADVSTEAVSRVEARLIALTHHMAVTAQELETALNYIESLLRRQLVAAVGKEVTAADFTKYMAFHFKKVYRPEAAPQPFCFAVRLPDHSSEGVVAIEAAGALGGSEQIATFRRHMSAPAPPMTFALDAATTVTFGGERYLHAYIGHRFGAYSEQQSLTLSVRARQFSCFMLLIGRLGPNNTFQPQHAMIVRNKDELTIPLMLETLPSAAEFRDAIASLSPEQQRFCKAYRSMQLEGTVFGLLVLQLKPQLERLLRLPPDALVKETALTETLLELFIDYQIPSDLLSFDGDLHASAAEKLTAVKAHVAAIKATIDEAKRAEVDAERQAFEYAHPSAFVDQEEVGQPERAEEDTSVYGGFASVYGGFAGSAAPEPPRVMKKKSMMASKRGVPGGPSMRGSPMLMAAMSMRKPAPMPREQLREQCEAMDTMVASSCADMSLSTMAAERQVGPVWQKRAQKALLATPTTSSLGEAEQKSQKDAAFDLLDGLSRSGTLPIDCATLHVVLCTTHCFDDSLIDTVVVRNANPIEKLERSSLIIGETILGKPAQQLLRAEEVDRVAKFSAPMLLE